MKYTFEITVSGCNTNCKHCYVNGGHGKRMSVEDFVFATQKLSSALKLLKDSDIAVTLGHEIYNHPDIITLWETAKENFPACFSLSNGFENPTTGIALLKRKDSDKIFAFLQKESCKTFMLTLHGNESHHDEIVEKSGAYKAISEFKDIIISNGFAPMYNIMINKYVAGDLSFLAQDFLADNFAYRLTIPLYVPTDRMRAFQKLRANLSDCIRVAESLKQSGLDDAGFRSKALSGSEQNIRENIKNWDINIADKNQPQWAFFNIAQDLSLFYGNVGLHTKYLGNIRDMSAEQIVCAITAQLPNFDYSAYYDIAALPSISQIADRADISNNYVYSDVASCIYSWLDSNGTLNILQ